MTELTLNREIPLPDSYPRDLKDYNLLANIFFLMALLDLSYLFEQLTSLQLIRQSLIMIIPSLTFLMYFHHEIQVRPPANIIMNPRVLFFFSMILAALFRVPFYSLVGLGTVSWLIWKEFNQEKDDFQLQHTEGLIEAVFLTFTALCMLVDEGVLHLAWKVVFALPIFIIFCAFSFFIYKELDDCLRIQRYHSSIYRSTHSYYFNISFMVLFLTNLVVLFSQNYLESNLFFHLISWTTTGVSLATLLLFVFFEEIVLFSINPKFTQQETMFRTNQRQFDFLYNEKTCGKDQTWQSQECLLCSNQASIVNFPCGHLTVCEFCLWQRWKKHFLKCIFCGRQIIRHCKIQTEDSQRRYGFQKKFFIEKKLYKNQVIRTNILQPRI